MQPRKLEDVTMREIGFKTSVAVDLFGEGITPKRLMELIGREKPAGQHHMRYTPADLRAARYSAAGHRYEENQSNLFTNSAVPVIITRMTKGGVGKTSASVNLAAAIGMMGYRVLLIDCDPQASATTLLLGDSEVLNNNVRHIGHFLLEKTDGPSQGLEEAIIPIYEGGFLSVLPSDITLAESDASMVVAVNSHERALRFFTRNKAFLQNSFDLVIVDTAPGTTPIGLAFTYAAKISGKILTIMEPVGDCIRALESLATNLAELKSLTDANIGIEIVVNKYHPSLKHVKDNMGILYSKYNQQLNDIVIPQFAGFSRQMDSHNRNNRPLVESDPTSIGARSMIELAKNLVASYGVTHPGIDRPTSRKTDKGQR